jgi:pilus assembly protein TadC
VTVAGPSGWLLAAGVGIAVHRWLSGRSSRADNDRAVALRRDLPLALDLMAAALVSGATTPAALALAAQGTGAPVATALHEVATSIQLGADPEEAWRSALREPALAPLGRLATRSTASGSAMAQACRQLAARSREALVVEARVAVKRAGVLSVLPLALCFLPAFVLVGIVPVVAGLLRSLVL